jgi:hypothetical protein
MSAVVETGGHRGASFRVLQQTPRSQTAVMTIAPGADARSSQQARARS